MTMAEKQKADTTFLYRVENPTIPATPNGQTSHEAVVGQWFAPSPTATVDYLRKATQTFGRNSGLVDGARMVVAEVPTEQLGTFHVSAHPTLREMDTENNNYIVPRDGSVPTTEVPLDEIVGDLRGKLGRPENLAIARERIVNHLGELSLV